MTIQALKIFCARTFPALCLILIVWTGKLFAGQAQTRAENPGPRAFSDVLPQAAKAGAGSLKPLRQDQEYIKEKGLSQPVRILLGFLVPGLTQYLDGKNRSYGYFALEGAGIAGLVLVNSKGNSHKGRYMDLTRVARENFVYPGLRNNTDETTDPLKSGFGEYYEDLLKWPSSGDYDNDPAEAGVQPEADLRTYNGHQWKIAQINNYTGTDGGLPVPAKPGEDDQALQAYLRAVYPVEYNWDWTGLDREYQEYQHLFDKSEQAYRKRNTFVAILMANHLLSGLDLLISERLNQERHLRAARLELHLGLRRISVHPYSQTVPTLNLSRSF